MKWRVKKSGGQGHGGGRVHVAALTFHHETRVCVQSQTWRYFLTVILIFLLLQVFQLLNEPNLHCSLFATAGGGAGGRATGASAPITPSLDPPVAPRQRVCINNTMTDFLK